MKKTKTLLLIATFFTISHLSKAQYNKGSKFWLAEGTFIGSIYSDSQISDASFFTKDNQVTSHNITLSFKKANFTEKNIAKGWLLAYNIISTSQSSTTSTTKYTYIDNYNHTLNGAYFIDKFIPLNKFLAVYGEVLGKIGFGFNSGKGVASTHEIHIGANANVGIRYFINKQLFINGQTSLVDISLKSLTADSKTSTNININSLMTVSTVSIGIGKSF